MDDNDKKIEEENISNSAKEDQEIDNELKKEVEGKKKYNIFKIIGNTIFWLFIVAFAICAVFSYINFNKVEDNEEPTNYQNKREYTEEDKNVTAYDYYIYKIVKVVDTKGTKVSLKLWFFDDFVKEEE